GVWPELLPRRPSWRVGLGSSMESILRKLEPRGFGTAPGYSGAQPLSPNFCRGHYVPVHLFSRPEPRPAARPPHAYLHRKGERRTGGQGGLGVLVAEDRLARHVAEAHHPGEVPGILEAVQALRRRPPVSAADRLQPCPRCWLWPVQRVALPAGTPHRCGPAGRALQGYLRLPVRGDWGARR